MCSPFHRKCSLLEKVPFFDPDSLTNQRMMRQMRAHLSFQSHLNSFAHEVMGIGKIRLSEVGEPVEDEDVAKVKGGVDLDQLVGSPL